MREIGAGRRPYPVSTAKRHHIVPQFLLARFAAPASNEGRLFYLDRRGGGSNGRIAVRDAAQRHRFYAVETAESTKDNRIEAFLGLIETHAAAALEKLLSDPSEMDEYDQIDIAMFLTMQTQRTPMAVARTEALVQQTAEEVFRDAAADPQRFTGEIAEVATDMSRAEIEAGRRELLKAIDEGRLKNRNLREEAWVATIDAWWEWSRYPLENSWYLLRPADGEFIVSDEGFAGVPIPNADRGTETTFPLAPDACLMLRSGSPGLRFVELPKRDVELVNLRTYGWADRFIYGRTQAAVTDTRALAKRKRHHVPRRPRGSLLPAETVRGVVRQTRPR